MEGKTQYRKSHPGLGSAPSTLVRLIYAIIAITLATKESAVSSWAIGRWKMGGSVFNLSVNAQASEVCC